MGYTSFSDYLYNSPLTHFSAPPATTCYSSPLPYHHHSTPAASSAAPHMVGHGLAMDHLHLPLPAQPLGLNLSFHGFNSVDVDVISDIDVGGSGKVVSTSSFDPPLIHHQQPSPTSSYSVYSSPSVAAGGGQENTSVAAAAEADPSLHRVLDEEEMAAIYSIGEQHDIEWSDTVNLVTSAWWSKLLDTVEGGGQAEGQEAAAVAGGGAVYASPEDEPTATATPDWFGDNCLGHHHQMRGKESTSSDVLGMHFGEYYHHHHGEDVSLPRMDLGEIEGWDAEWFS
uniref:Uncharacterized protein n=1 Tax=Leersia perrieri TaxID=77586 RepID=A0A0D9VV34_9ORYZ